MTGPRVLAIDPMRRGFGYVVFEGLALLVDWGTRLARTDKHVRSLEHLDELIDTYAPDVLVVEDCTARGSRRCERVQKLLDEMVELAESKHIEVRRIGPREVEATFEDLIEHPENKHDFATVVAELYPPLRPQLPPERATYESETERMAIFDAAAMALAVLLEGESKERRRAA